MGPQKRTMTRVTRAELKVNLSPAGPVAHYARRTVAQYSETKTSRLLTSPGLPTTRIMHT
jgi:hypothetical protein